MPVKIKREYRLRVLHLYAKQFKCTQNNNNQTSTIMKNFLLYGFLLTLILTGCQHEQNLPMEYKEGLAIFTDNGKYGYIDSVRKIIIPAQYDIAKDFHNGMAYVSKAKKWGYIDRTGREIIPIRYDYIYGYVWDYGIPYAIVELQGKQGYINKAGKIILPIEYDYLHNGIAPFDYAPIQKNGKVGLLNKEYKIAIPCSFDQIQDFQEGLCAVQVSGRWGYVDSTGTVAIPIRYSKAEPFYQGSAPVLQNEHWFLINKTAQRISARYDTIYPLTDSLTYRVCKDSLYGTMNAKGRLLTKLSRNDSIAPAKTNSTLEADPPVDSLYFTWRTDTIPYLFGKPSPQKISRYKAIIDSLRPNGHLGEGSPFHHKYFTMSNEHKFVLNDIYQLCTETNIEENINLAVWRINEFYPLSFEPGETEIDRYNKFCKQIDSILSYEPLDQVSFNDSCGLSCVFTHIKTNLYHNRIVAQCDDLLLDPALLAIEFRAWKQYADQERKFILNKLAEEEAGSGRDIEFYRVVDESRVQYLQALLNIYFSLTVDQYHSKNQFGFISNSLLNKAFNDYKQSISFTYKKDVEKSYIRWKQWMAQRDKISHTLSGKLKTVYDNSTNIIKRNKLIQFKNRYEQYGCGERSWLNMLLSDDCTDKELTNFDFTKKWDEYTHN